MFKKGCFDGHGTNIKTREGSGLCQMYSHHQCLQMIENYEEQWDHRYDRVTIKKQQKNIKNPCFSI